MIADDIATFIGRYVVVDDDKRLIMALWVLHTYCFEVFPQTPYLAINSPERECGKTRLVETLEQVCHRSWSVINPSESVVYRKINSDKPTLLLDEVDGLFKKGSPYEHLVTLLNTGNRATARVPRVLNPRSDELIEYNVFCPKVLAGIGKLPDTIGSRSIPIRLERKTRSQPVEDFRARDVEPAATALRDQIASWIQDAEIDDEPQKLGQLTDRQQDCVEPLLSIADALGCGTEARAALVRLFMAERLDIEETDGVKLLRDLRTVFDNHPGAPAGQTATLLKELKELPESQWVSYDYGRGITAQTMGKLLKDYGVKSETIRGQFVDDDGSVKQTKKGYRRDKLKSAWERYLPDTSGDAANDNDATAEGVTVTADVTLENLD